MIKPSQRITYRYEGGPLDGRTTYHALRPDDLSAKVLHRHTTCLKDADIDRTAAGIYHIEERGGLSPKPPLIAEEEEDMVGLESLEESKPKPQQVEFVAVHHKSDQDEEWHVVKKEKEKQDGPDADLH